MEPKLYLLAYQNNQLKPHPLPALDEPGGRCEVVLRSLPGSRRMRVLLQEGGETVLRAEMDVNPGTPALTLEIRRRPDGGEGSVFKLACREGAPVRLLSDRGARPLEDQHEAPIQWLGPPRSIDLAIVVDMTARRIDVSEKTPPTVSLLLAKPPKPTSDAAEPEPWLWEAQVEQLCRFVEELRSACPNLRVCVLGFGDQPMPGNVTADDLRPKYHLYPEKPWQRSLQAMDTAALRSRLLEIPPSPGGDFVDALADALAAAHDDLLWAASRKLLLVCGESPGYSILNPLRKGDACVREHDVDTQALRLHRKGVAVLTLYQQQPSNYLKDLTSKEQIELQKAAHEQYAGLAALPAFAFECAPDAAGFDGTQAAQEVLKYQGLVGYGGCCGEWPAPAAEAHPCWPLVARVFAQYAAANRPGA